MKTVGTICRSLILPINLIIDRIGGPSIRHRRFVLIVVLCVVGFFVNAGILCFLNSYVEIGMKIMRTAFWQKRPLEPTQ